MRRTVLTAAALLTLCGAVRAAEVTTNGVGGGDWSEPATWRGKQTPGADDDVVIRKGDVVVFDRDDDGKVTCGKLSLDPRGGLKFRTGKGKVVLCVAGEVEAYGPISLDGVRGAKDRLELRFVGDGREKRSLKLQKGGALVARGRPYEATGEPNVVLTSLPPGAGKQAVPLLVQAVGGSTVDLQNVAVVNAFVQGQDIDSTGAKPGEKFSVIGCRLSGLGRVFAQRCDTPVICRNTVGHPDPKRREGRALYVTECPLAEVRDNVVTGGFEFGVASSHGPDVAFTGNTVDNCTIGIHLGFGSGQTVSRNTVRGCDTAFDLAYPKLVTLEDNRVEGAKTVVRTTHATSQFTGLFVDKLPADAVGVLYGNDGTQSGGYVTLLNCNLRPEQVKISMPPRVREKPPVTSLYYAVVGVKKAPPDAEVVVATVGYQGDPEGDLNVRNSPASVGKGGLTPLPQPSGAPLTLSPLVVKGWSIDYDGKTVPAPEYAVRVLAPAGAPGAERKVLGEIKVRPSAEWFRAKPEEPTPTLEVPLK